MKPDQIELLTRLGELRQELRDLERELRLDRPPRPPAPGAPLGLAAYQLVAEYASDFISIHAANGDYLFASPASKRLLGWEPEELLGRNAYEFIHPRDIPRVAADHAQQEVSGEGRVRYRLRAKDGSYRWVETRGRSHVAEEGLQQVVTVTRDIHGEMQGELARLITAMVGSLAHEINNPLSAAILALNTLESDADGSLATVRASLFRIADVLGEVTDLASEAPGKRGRINVGQVVDRAAQRFVHDAGNVVSRCGDAEVYVERLRFRQLVQTLLLVYLQDPEDEPVDVHCKTSAEDVSLTFEGRVTALPSTMRADLGAILNGEAPEPALPLRIAERLAQQLGAWWRLQQNGGQLRIELRFQNQAPPP